MLGKRIATASIFPRTSETRAIAQFCTGGRLRNGRPCCRGTIQSPLAIISRATCPRRGSSPLGGVSLSRDP